MDLLTIQIECRPITSGGQSFRASHPWPLLGHIHPLAAMLVNVHVDGQVIRFSKGIMDKYFDIRIQIQQIQSRSEVLIRFETPRTRLIIYLLRQNQGLVWVWSFITFRWARQKEINNSLASTSVIISAYNRISISILIFP